MPADSAGQVCVCHTVHKAHLLLALRAAVWHTLTLQDIAGCQGLLCLGQCSSHKYDKPCQAASSHPCMISPLHLQVIAGLDWVKANHKTPAAVVMALGGDGQTALDMAVHNLAVSGLAVFVAAGNEDTDACTKSPARY